MEDQAKILFVNVTKVKKRKAQDFTHECIEAKTKK